MNFITNKSKGVVMTLVSLLFVIISAITYGVNVSQAGYFQGASVSRMVQYEVLTMVILCLTVIVAQFKLEGAAGKVVDFALSVLRVAACVFIAFALINLVGARVEGLGFIYFSNADVTLEVQTPANLASSKGTIFNIVILAVTLVVNMVSSFFNLKKEA